MVKRQELKEHPDYIRFRNLMTIEGLRYTLPQLREIHKSDIFKRFARLYPAAPVSASPHGEQPEESTVQAGAPKR